MLGWQSLLKSWLAVQDKLLSVEYSVYIHSLITWLVDPCAEFIGKHCKVRLISILGKF